MKQKEWKNCPACGAKGSMNLKKYLRKRFDSKSYPSIQIGPVSLFECKQCHDGIYTLESSNLIEAKLSEHKARHDAKTTVIEEVMHVSEASKVLKMTRQGIIQLMKRGKIPYVFFGKSRVPKRQAVLQYVA